MSNEESELSVEQRFQPSDKSLALFSSYCGINDREELKKKLIDFQSKALSVHPYKCIQEFRYAKFIHPNQK